jgi:hypothetical protein
MQLGESDVVNTKDGCYYCWRERFPFSLFTRIHSMVCKTNKKYIERRTRCPLRQICARLVAASSNFDSEMEFLKE